MTDNKITKAKISARLRAAGFEASRQTTTAVRGWYNFSSGYVVDANEDGKFATVTFRGSYKTDIKRAKEMVNLYASALIAQGHNVEINGYGDCAYVVADKEEDTMTEPTTATKKVDYAKGVEVATSRFAGEFGEATILIRQEGAYSAKHYPFVVAYALTDGEGMHSCESKYEAIAVAEAITGSGSAYAHGISQIAREEWKRLTKLAELNAAIRECEEQMDSYWEKGAAIALAAVSDKVLRLQDEVRALRNSGTDLLTEEVVA